MINWLIEYEIGGSNVHLCCEIDWNCNKL